MKGLEKLNAWNPLKGKGSVVSGLGWPVPAAVRIVNSERVMKIVTTAHENGYSRKGRGLDLDRYQWHAVVPYLWEASPKPCWMCLVVSFLHPVDVEFGVRQECKFARLDISVEDLDSLPVAGAQVRDQLLHWMAWEAFRRRDQVPDGRSDRTSES